ncbi:hypothetical protein Tco_0712449, partial [Tanacetum coccineum]
MAKGEPKRKKAKKDVFTVNLYYDGLVTSCPMIYFQGQCRVLTDTNFDEMIFVHLLEILKRLVPNSFEKVYYCKSGAKLTSIREIKSDQDIVDLLKDQAELNSSDDDYHYSNDDLEEIENVDFHTEGDDSVVIKNITTQDPFLTKLCSARILFKGNVEYELNEETPQVDPDDNQIDPVYKLKMELENYGVAHGFQLWYMKNDWRQVLVYCGRNIVEGRCAAFKNGISEILIEQVLGLNETNYHHVGGEIRLYIMQRIVAMNKLAFNLEDTITPSIRKRLEILKEKQRMWESSGIPCVHVVAAYMHVGSELDAGVSYWYSRESWFNAYQFSIKLVFRTNMWKRTNDVPPLSPIIR